MMKASIALCAASAVAVAPPKIALDLAALHNAYKLDKSVYRTHDLDAQKAAGVKSRQDWTEKCAAGVATNKDTCPFPVAKAYDHQDKEVTVSTRVFKVDADGTMVNQQVESVDFSKRSTYLFKYDASDASGNHAEQVVFALILDDTTAPVINMCGAAAETWESASGKKICGSSTATDNIDGSLTKDLKYHVQKIEDGSTSTYNGAADVTVTGARARLSSKTTGRFLVTLSVSDKAGAYGHNGANNSAEARKAILIQDTTPPKVTIHGAIPAVNECATKYTDEGATALDALDGQTTVVRKVGVSPNKVGDYAVTYTSTDATGNISPVSTRQVQVRDTTKPTITIKGAAAMVHYSEDAFAEPGVTYADTCDKTLATHSQKWNKAFNDRKLGDYVRTYSVTDKSGNTNSVTRKYTVVDNKVPIIELVGSSVETHEATRDADYQDNGAGCQDFVDGVLNHAVETTGDTVNFRVPATYKVHYDCQDLSGNAAKRVTRTVVVQDTTCPTVKVLGNTAVNYIEAGFPYVDAGATATDSLDGDISKKVFTDGDTVNTSQAFYSRRSCSEIKASYAEAKTGEYYITTYANGEYKRVMVWCDMASSSTYYVCNNCDRVAKAYSTEQGSCAKLGLKMATFADAAAKAAPLAKFSKTYFADASTDDYLCTATAATGTDSSVTYSAKSEKITRAESGKYVIFYHVTDKAMNAECTTHKRTVIVKDTLPPVITLHLQKKLIHTSATGGKGLGGQANPAGTAANPFVRDWTDAKFVSNSFMAESTTSVNGWVLAAVASAVTGVALVGFSMKKSQQVSVPV